MCETALEAQWSSGDDGGGGGGGGAQRFQGGGEKLRDAFCSVAWAERMERQEELVKKYQVRSVCMQYAGSTCAGRNPYTCECVRCMYTRSS